MDFLCSLPDNSIFVGWQCPEGHLLHFPSSRRISPVVFTSRHGFPRPTPERVFVVDHQPGSGFSGIGLLILPPRPVGKVTYPIGAPHLSSGRATLTARVGERCGRPAHLTIVFGRPVRIDSCPGPVLVPSSGPSAVKVVTPQELLKRLPWGTWCQKQDGSRVLK